MEYLGAADAHTARGRTEPVWPIGVEAGEVDETQRPAAVEDGIAPFALQCLLVHVPLAAVTAGVFEHRRQETRRRELQVTTEPRAVLGSGSAVARVDGAKHLFDTGPPPGQETFGVRAAAHRHDRGVDAACILQPGQRRLQTVARHVVHCTRDKHDGV
jgi:hypothetical protein